MLKIYTDFSWVPFNQPPVVILQPFHYQHATWFVSDVRYRKYAKSAYKLFSLTSLPESDFALLPVSWENIITTPSMMLNAKKFVTLAAAAGKRTIIFYFSDNDEDIPLTDVIIFRTSIYASKRKNYEFAMPAWNEDLKKINHPTSTSNKFSGDHRPSISFCGQAPNQSKQSFINSTWNHLSPNQTAVSVNIQNTATARQIALRILSSVPQINSNFIIRRKFYGSSPNRKWRADYITNMQNADYALCVRGAGNYSYRLYEAMSMGKIPVIINTDIVLPYENIIDWRSFSIIVNENDLAQLPSVLINYHRRHNAQQLLAIKHRSRVTWENFISPQGFFKNIHLLLNPLQK